jgi:Major Facilitator Superfamily
MRLSKITKILLWGANVWFFGEGLLGPLFAVFTERLGGDVMDITGAWAIFLIMTGVCYIITGKLTSRFKKSIAKVMLAGYILNAIFTFGYLFVKTPEQLFLIQAGLGISEAIGSPPWDSLYAKSLNETNEIYAWGLAGGQAQILTGLAALAGGLIVVNMSFDALFIIMGLIQVIATVIQSRVLFLKST